MTTGRDLLKLLKSLPDAEPKRPSSSLHVIFTCAGPSPSSLVRKAES